MAMKMKTIIYFLFFQFPIASTRSVTAIIIVMPDCVLMHKVVLGDIFISDQDPWMLQRGAVLHSARFAQT